MIDNISITSDSEIGYHVYINYTDYKEGEIKRKCVYYWVTSEVVENVFEEIKETLEEIKNE